MSRLGACVLLGYYTGNYKIKLVNNRLNQNVMVIYNSHVANETQKFIWKTHELRYIEGLILMQYAKIMQTSIGATADTLSDEYTLNLTLHYHNQNIYIMQHQDRFMVSISNVLVYDSSMMTLSNFNTNTAKYVVYNDPFEAVNAMLNQSTRAT